MIKSAKNIRVLKKPQTQIQSLLETNKYLYIVIPIGFMMIFGLVLFITGVYKQANANGKPNIIVFMTDDQTLEQMRVMPNVKSHLSQKGVTFNNYIASNSMCCPSRATYFTGQYAHNNGVYGNSAPDGGYSSLIDKQTIMPVALKNAGYTTIQIGKYLNEYGKDNPSFVPKGWSEWHALPEKGFTNGYYNYDINHNGTIQHYGNTPNDYSADVFKNIALEQITKASNSTNPFYLNLAFFAPHYNPDPINIQEPPVPALRHQNLFLNEMLPNTPSMNEADISDKPAHIRDNDIGELAYPRLGITPLQNYRKELGALQAVDEAIGAVMQRVDQLGLTNNTVFIFTSDNGFYRGEHRIPSSKYFAYEEGVHLPLIIRAPNIREGSIQNLVGNIDLAPTIMDFAGATTLRLIDGHSLRPLLMGQQASWNRPMLLQGDKGTAKWPSFVGIRTDRYKYLQYQNGENELYDLQTDPYELASKHNDPTYASIKKKLITKLKTLKDCKGRDCDVPPYGFSDVPESMPTINAIVWSAKNNISSWYASNNFKPNDDILRGDAIGWLWRMSGSPATLTPSGYSDVASTDPNYQAINWSKLNNLPSNNNDNTFSPNSATTRGQLAQWIWVLNGAPINSPNRNFSDVSTASPYYRAINWMVDKGFADGYDNNTFKPNDNVPRKKTASWLWISKGQPN